MMIGYVTLGSDDVQRGAKFYDALLAEIGAARMMEGDNFIAWTTGEGQPGIGLTKPFNGEAATVGNGVMVAIACPSPDIVDRLHKKALDLGGADEGAPGLRGDTFYAGYFRDLDGNKLNAFCMT